MCDKCVSGVSESDSCVFLESVDMDLSSGVSVHDAEEELLIGAMDSESGKVCVTVE